MGLEVNQASIVSNEYVKDKNVKTGGYIDDYSQSIHTTANQAKSNNSINVSGYVQQDKLVNYNGIFFGAAPNAGDTPQNVKFTDTNNNGVIDAGDQVTYTGNDSKEMTTTVKTTRNGAMPAQQDVALANGQRVITTKANLAQGNAIFNFEAKQVEADGKTAKIQTALENADNNTDGTLLKSESQYRGAIKNMVHRFSNDSEPVLSKTIEKAKAEETKNKPPIYTMLMAGAYKKDKPNLGSSELLSGQGKTTELTLAGVRKYVEAPAREKISKEITLNDLNGTGNANDAANLDY